MLKFLMLSFEVDFYYICVEAFNRFAYLFYMAHFAFIFVPSLMTYFYI